MAKAPLETKVGPQEGPQEGPQDVNPLVPTRVKAGDDGVLTVTMPDVQDLPAEVVDVSFTRIDL